ncbi:hypothetical protein MMC25_006307 [Agyrium rufum]|nr:hypothetical protein [Agyrium rufum]
MAPPKITLYVDLISPFTYIAFHVLRISPAFKPCEITFVFILLGGVMKACGNTPPLTIKNKGKWINEERIKKARLFNVPMKEDIFPGFPFRSLEAQRALTAATMTHPCSKLEELLAVLWDSIFVQHRSIAKPEEFTPLFAQVLGEEAAKEVIEKSASPEAKNKLTSNSEEAMNEGAFGLPWFVVINASGETDRFFGVDSIKRVALPLGLDIPSTEIGWRTML